MKPVPTACAFCAGRCGLACGMPFWPKRSAKRCMNSSICCCCWPERSDIWTSSPSSAAPAFMVTATLTTAGVTLAARSEKSCTPGTTVRCGGDRRRRGEQGGDQRRRRQRRRQRQGGENGLGLRHENNLLRGALAKEIWDLAHGERMAAALNVCIVGEHCVWPEMAADAAGKVPCCARDDKGRENPPRRRRQANRRLHRQGLARARPCRRPRRQRPRRALSRNRREIRRHDRRSHAADDGRAVAGQGGARLQCAHAGAVPHHHGRPSTIA